MDEICSGDVMGLGYNGGLRTGGGLTEKRGRLMASRLRVHFREVW